MEDPLVTRGLALQLQNVFRTADGYAGVGCGRGMDEMDGGTKKGSS